jgi:hypothetical protein
MVHTAVSWLLPGDTVTNAGARARTYCEIAATMLAHAAVSMPVFSKGRSDPNSGVADQVSRMTSRGVASAAPPCQAAKA